MPVSYRHKFIFFHIPRCAGTSLEYYYEFHDGNPLFGFRLTGSRVMTLQHLTYREVATEGILTRETLDSFFKFTIIRDPFSRMVSDYFWQKSKDRPGEFKDLDFQQYLDVAERVMEEDLYFKRTHYDHFRPMVEYCYLDGRPVLDDILVLERIDTDIARIRERIQIDQMLNLNSSNPDVEELRTPENIDRVYSLYADDKALYDAVVSGEGVAEYRGR